MAKLKGCLFVEKRFLNNQIFSQKLNETINYSISKYIDLKYQFSKKNIDLSTQDILKPEKADFILYIDYNRIKNKTKKKYLIVNEPDIIIPENHNINFLKKFDLVFTWNDNLIDNKRILKFNNLSYDFRNKNLNDKMPKKKYLFVTSNKLSSNKNENYN